MKRLLAATVTVLALSGCQTDRALSPARGTPDAAPALSVSGVSAAAFGPLVNFEGLGLLPGASVEGLGTVHPYLNIQDASVGGGGAKYVVEGVAPEAYVAAGSLRLRNGCLGNPGGWTATGVSADGAGFSSNFGALGPLGENYVFTFGGLAVNRFSIRMLDFGDFNPTGGTNHRVAVTAFDANGVLVDTDVLAFTSGPGSSPADLQKTGDACTAALGEPGNYVFSVAGAGITRVELHTDESGADPNVVFDDIELGLAVVAIDIKPGGYPNCINNDGKGVIPVAILGSAAFDVRRVDAATVALQGLAVKTAGKADKLLVGYEDVNRDGYLDLVVQIQDQDQVLTNGTGIATLTGKLTDGTPFVGSDEICVVPPNTGA